METTIVYWGVGVAEVTWLAKHIILNTSMDIAGVRDCRIPPGYDLALSLSLSLPSNLLEYCLDCCGDGGRDCCKNRCQPIGMVAVSVRYSSKLEAVIKWKL